MANDDGHPSYALPDAEVTRWTEHQDHIEVMARLTALAVPCRRCGQLSSKVYDYRTQRKRDRVAGLKPIWVILVKRRFRCPQCGAVFLEPDPICGLRQRTTKRMRSLVQETAQNLSLKGTAWRLNVTASYVWRAAHQEEH